MTDGAPAPGGSVEASAPSSTWVLLRGLTREVGHWGDFPDRLSEALPGARGVTIDLPGNGRLNGLRSPIAIDAMTSHCREQLLSSGIAPPYHLLAMSLGAMVAVDWADRHPAELSGCVLLNTSLRPFSPWYRRLRPANLFALLQLSFGHLAPHEKEAVVLRLTSRHPPNPRAVLDHWTALRRARPVDALNAVRQLVAAARYRAPLQSPATPLLILSSACDGLVDPHCSHVLARRWNVELAVHPTAGHDLALDDAPWVVAQVRRWLDARGGLGEPGGFQ